MYRVLIGALVLVSVNASAQLDSGYYLGAAVGQMDYTDSGFSQSIDDSTDIFRLYGGFRFDDTWAMEAHYGQSGDLAWFESITVPGSGSFTADVTSDWRILQVRGIGHFRAFYGGIGYWDADVDLRAVVTDPDNNTTDVAISDSDEGYAVIVGGEWEFRDWAIRAEYEYFNTNSGVDLSTLSFGGHFKF
jgi:hypothetical protein